MSSEIPTGVVYLLVQESDGRVAAVFATERAATEFMRKVADPHEVQPWKVLGGQEVKACDCQPTVLMQHVAGCVVGWPPVPPGGYCAPCRGTGGFVTTPSGERPTRRYDRMCVDCGGTGKVRP